MKDILTDIGDWMKNTKITKHCDSQTSFLCGKSSSSPLTLSLKGDLTVTAAQVLAVVAVMTVAGITMSIAKKIKG